jgi:endonuclease/exonuclease/phosphatase family metal-dependent hydrolase
MTWNINHRTTQKAIPSTMAHAIVSLNPDIVVLTEYVPGSSRQVFLNQLTSFGLSNIITSDFAKGENHVLIASRSTLEPRDLRAPEINSSAPPNSMHVYSPLHGVEILGLRIPDYSKQPALRQKYWDWIINTAKNVGEHPFAILGDFNTDPGYPRARCGPRIAELLAVGWQHALPSVGASFWGTNSTGVRIDHAFVTKHFTIQSARYVTESNGHIFVGKTSVALSDHAALLAELVNKHETATSRESLPVVLSDNNDKCASL